MQDYMTPFEHDGKRYRVVYDEDHQTRGSYAYDTEEETRAAEDEEIANLESGRWVVVGCIVSQPHEQKCTVHCPAWEETDSLWGIVVKNDETTVRQTVLELMA